MKIRQSNLSRVEQLVMECVWRRGKSSAEACREALWESHPMKDSTVRTVLRRLEEKGFLRHEVEGRTFIYGAVEARMSTAARAVRHVINRFCGGSVEQLLTGMVESDVLDRKELRRLAEKIARSKMAKG